MKGKDFMQKITALDNAALLQEQQAIYSEYRILRLQQQTKSMPNFRTIRKNIARINTVLNMRGLLK